MKNITVLGSGVMGHGIAQVVATTDSYNNILRNFKNILKGTDKDIYTYFQKSSFLNMDLK